jgi:hypothetical protein
VQRVYFVVLVLQRGIRFLTHALALCLFAVAVQSTRVYTSSDQLYRTLHRSLLDTQQTVFKVKASSDAKISLLRVPSNFLAPSYEIIVGAEFNTRTILHSKAAGGDQVVFQVNTPDILSSAELRSFWVSWMNGTVRFGKGDTPGQNELMNYVDPQPAFRRHVHSIAVASGLGIAEWELGQAFGIREYICIQLAIAI